ncbi:hypothetical protein DJ64_01630 [Streptomyces griseorubens]|uniref:Uncharacterized protein n=1 Tax=Streptomyces griseorubens TaxID=66897 RepID=A0ABR4T2M3_9ACTN|nr:hypothetical protein DJ64_01630 [Streptomyces griseorubens]
MVDVGAEVPVAGVVEGVDAALCVDGEECLGVGFGAEGADLGVEGAAEVAEGAGEVQSVQGVDVERGGGDLAAGSGGPRSGGDAGGGCRRWGVCSCRGRRTRGVSGCRR